MDAVDRALELSERCEAARVAAELSVTVKAFGHGEIDGSRKAFLAVRRKVSAPG